jgi:hypothetical protein
MPQVKKLKELRLMLQVCNTKKKLRAGNAVHVFPARFYSMDEKWTQIIPSIFFSSGI